MEISDWRNLVAMFLEKKDYVSVRRYAQMLVELQPDSPVAAEALATLAFSEGDFATAARYCNSLSQWMPDRFENWFNLGVAYHKLGDFQKAAHAYEQAAVLNPQSLQSHLNLGVARQELNDLAGARASYEKALEIDPSQAGVLWNLALVLEQQGERKSAEQLYARIGRDATEYGDARFRLGYLRLLGGESPADYQASAEAFQECLSRRADWPEAWLNSGIAFARSSRLVEARRCFEETLMLRPDSSDAVRGLEALALDQSRGRPQEADAQADRL